MHTMLKVMNVVSEVLLICTLICGIWIGIHPESNLEFHAYLSGISVVVAILVQAITMNKCRFCKKTIHSKQQAA